MSKEPTQGVLNRAKYWASALIKDARKRSRKRSLDLDIDATFVREIWEKQNGLCYWSGLEMKPSTTPHDPFQPSLERIDCSRGYTKDNCVLSCRAMNTARGNISTELWIEFLTKWKEEGIVKQLEVQDL